MNIAFDLDDTLIPLGTSFETEGSLLTHLFKSFRLRKGTYFLIKLLKDEKHKIWVYTRSHRSCLAIKCLFLLNGIVLDGVVNSKIHHEKIAELDEYYQDCYKYPPMFNLDLLIDDGKYFYEDSIKFKFDMLLIDPIDKNWAKAVMEKITD